MEESDIIYARGAFPDVQTELDVYPSLLIDGLFTCGWYGTAVNEERGSFAIVNDAGPLADKVGDYLRVSYGRQHATVYCLETLTIPYDIVITRRAYFQLAELWAPYLDVRVSDIADTFDGS